MTAVESTGGYIFGGYPDVLWKSVNDQYNSSENAFLFSLKWLGGLSAVKMNDVDIISKDIYRNSSYDPDDNTTQSSYSAIGATYNLPPGAIIAFFLTGQLDFQVSEYEVFQVQKYAIVSTV